MKTPTTYHPTGIPTSARTRGAAGRLVTDDVLGDWGEYDRRDEVSGDM